jgi:hypothetical protein
MALDARLARVDPTTGVKVVRPKTEGFAVWTVSDVAPSFTLGHEFGHYVRHRDLIETDPRFEGGVYCDETSILRRQGQGPEKEADRFADRCRLRHHAAKSRAEAR